MLRRGHPGLSVTRGHPGLPVTHSDAFAVPVRSRSETEETQPPFLQEAPEPFPSCLHSQSICALVQRGFSATNKTKIGAPLSLPTTHWPTVNSDSVMKLGAVLVGTGWLSQMKAVEES